jgi:hypothetical protein
MSGYADSSAHRDVGPPAWPFALSAPAVLVSAALAVLAPRSVHLVRWSLVGWAAGAVVPILLLVAYRALDRCRRRRPEYTARAFAGKRMTAAAVLGAIAGGVNSWAAATWWASAALAPMAGVPVVAPAIAVAPPAAATPVTPSLVGSIAPPAAVAPTGPAGAQPTGQQPAPAQDAALRRLAGCVRERHALDVLILLDESHSLARTDHANLRVPAAAVAVDGLTRLVDPALATPGSGVATVQIALAGFAGGVTAGPWRDLGRDRDAIKGDIGGFAARNTGSATNYVEALRRAREILAGRAAAETAGGGGPPCQALIWLTDGEPAPDGTKTTPAAAEAHRRQLCAPGGPADQLRSSGVTLLTVALTGDLHPADEEFLRAVTGRPGGGCGTGTPGTEGAYLAAGDQRLDEAFAQLANYVDPIPLCQVAGACSFTLDRQIGSFIALIHTPGAGVGVLLRPPHGQPDLPLERPGQSQVVQLSGANLRWDWNGESVLVRGQLPLAAADQWSGTWQALVQGSDGRVSGGQVYLYGNLEQRIVGTPTFRRGEPWRFRVEIAQAGGPVATDLEPVRHELSVRLADGDDRRPATVTADPAAPAASNVAFTPPKDWHGSAVTVTVVLSVHTAAGVDISPPDLVLRVPVVTPLRLEPAELILPPVRGQQAADARLTVTAAETGGCVWVDGPAARFSQTPARLEFPPVAGASSAQQCLRVAAGTSAPLPVRLSVLHSWDGTVRGIVPVLMAVDGGEPLRVDVPVTVSLVSVADGPRRLAFFLAMLVLSGCPLLIAMLWNNLVVGRFDRPRALRVAVVRLAVSGDRIVPPAGPAWPASNEFQPVDPPPRYRFTAGPVTFRVRRSWLNPFANPRVVATAGDGLRVATEDAGPSPAIDRLPLNLTGGLAVAVAAAADADELTAVTVVVVAGDEPLVGERGARLRLAALDAATRHLHHQATPAATGRAVPPIT